MKNPLEIWKKVFDTPEEAAEFRDFVEEYRRVSHEHGKFMHIYANRLYDEGMDVRDADRDAERMADKAYPILRADSANVFNDSDIVGEVSEFREPNILAAFKKLELPHVMNTEQIVSLCACLHKEFNDPSLINELAIHTFYRDENAVFFLVGDYTDLWTGY